MADRNALIILAGGTGSRFNNKVNKTLATLNGVPLWEHVLLRYLKMGIVKSIVIVANEKIIDDIKKTVKKKYKNLPCSINVVKGGDTRQLSSHEGLKALYDFYPKNIIFQEAARPIINENTVRKGINILSDFDAVLPVQKSRDGLLNIDEKANIKSLQPRDETVCGIGPEFFKFSKIMEAFNIALKNKETKFPENCGLFVHYGGKVKCFFSSGPSLKVTHPYDLKIVESILKE